jgi:acid phosphatase
MRAVVLALALLLLGGCSSSGSPGHPRHAEAATTGTPTPAAPPAGSPSSSPTSSSPRSASTTSSGTTSSGTPAPASGSGPAGNGLPRPAHVVVVVLENHSFSEVIGRTQAPFIAGLARSGAVFTRFYAITHPSEPNYQALFSGSTQGLTSDACPVNYRAPNLGSSLLAARRTFVGYAESLPRSGFTGCTSGAYARKHCPWINFDLPARVSLPMTAFPRDLAALPTVSFVIPNLQHDMHDGTLAQADSWLRAHLGGYARWARAHNSLLIVTADEDDRSAGNQIPTIISGAHVRAGHYARHYTLYSLLRTIEDMYALPHLGNARTAATITGSWS